MIAFRTRRMTALPAAAKATVAATAINCVTTCDNSLKKLASRLHRLIWYDVVPGMT
jgi:hypothetical protein